MNTRTNHILIDFESVQPEQIAQLPGDNFKVTVFVGALQNKVSFELAESMQRLGQRANYVKISGNGPNALDFHIAFYIGLIATEDPTTFFHIVSKDTGFDPLIQHLKTKKIFCGRVEQIADIAAIKSGLAKTPSDRVALSVTKLQQMTASKPRTIKTLGTTLASLFQKQLTEAEVTALIEKLRGLGHISIDGTKVGYSLPEPAET